MVWLAVALGGALGSVARHAMNVAVHRVAGETVPYATAAVNIIGCFVIGALAGLITSGQLRLSETGRAFAFVGILGGFTTFSSLGLDTFTLVRSGEMAIAVANLAVQLVIGLGSVFAGYRLATLL